MTLLNAMNFPPGYFILKSLLFGLWYVVYFWQFQPDVLNYLARSPARPAPAFGLALVGLQLLELLGWWLKAPTLTAQINASRSQPPWIGFIFLMFAIMGHMGLVTTLLNFAVFDALGLELSGVEALLPGLLCLAFFILMLAKDGYLLVFLAGRPPKSALARRLTALVERFPHSAALLGDGLLAVFSALAYTVAWEQLVTVTPLRAATAGGRALEYFGAVILFCLAFPATHPLAVAEEWLVPRSRLARLLSLALFALAMLFALRALH
jgi:hypothetical protein